MLPRPHRLADRTAIRRVLARGLRCWRPLLGLRSVRNGKPHSRFVFVVSTKVSKRATERNRLRRHLREGVRTLLPTVAAGYDVAVIVLPVARGAAASALREQFTSAARQLGLLPPVNSKHQILNSKQIPMPKP